jgi:hypothetical protein
VQTFTDSWKNGTTTPSIVGAFISEGAGGR